MVNKPTHRAFGTRGVTDIAATVAIVPKAAPTSRIRPPSRGWRIGLMIKCAVAVWVIAVLFAVLSNRGGLLF